MRNTLKGVKKSLDDSDRARKAAIVRMVGIEHNVAMLCQLWAGLTIVLSHECLFPHRLLEQQNS